MQQSPSFTEFVDLTGSDSLELLDNARIAKLTGLEEQRIWKSTRMKERYILRAGKEPVDIALEITDRFLDQTGIRSSDIGSLALVHTAYAANENDRFSIADAVAKRVGVTRENIVAISYGCAGFPEIVSRAAIQAKRLDDGKHALILNVETPDRMMDAKDSRATPIFATGATATSLWNGDGHRLLFADSEHVVPPENPNNEKIFEIDQRDIENFSGEMCRKVTFVMNGNLAYNNGVALIERAAKESMAKVMENPLYRGRRILVVAHQPNGKMIKGLDDLVAPEMQKQYAGMGITDIRFANGMEGMGNVISATIPSVLARNASLPDTEPLKKGDIVLIPAAGICVEDPASKMTIARGAIEW